MNRFTRARELAGLSIDQAARLLDWRPERLTDIERHEQWSQPEIEALARLYHCAVSYLSGDPLPAHNAELTRQLEAEGVSDHDSAIILKFAQMLAMMPPQPTAANCLAPIYARKDDLLDQLSRESKVRYVKVQGQSRPHHCHWPGCIRQVPPAMWGCKQHWSRLPKALRDKIWAAYRPGQERDLTPSAEYLAVADEVQQWIKRNR